MKAVKNWQDATEELAKAFVKKYFPHEQGSKDVFWVGDEIGDVFCISDMFFSVTRMREALELNATYDQLQDYYWIETEKGIAGERMKINFKNYVKYGGDIT
jgi:hypothetical protein